MTILETVCYIDFLLAITYGIWHMLSPDSIIYIYTGRWMEHTCSSSVVSFWSDCQNNDQVINEDTVAMEARLHGNALLALSLVMWFIIQGDNIEAKMHLMKARTVSWIGYAFLLCWRYKHLFTSIMHLQLIILCSVSICLTAYAGFCPQCNQQANKQQKRIDSSRARKDEEETDNKDEEE